MLRYRRIPLIKEHRNISHRVLKFYKSMYDTIECEVSKNNKSIRIPFTSKLDPKIKLLLNYVEKTQLKLK